MPLRCFLQYFILYVLIYTPNFRLTGDSASLFVLGLSFLLCVNHWPALESVISKGHIHFSLMLCGAYLVMQLIALFGGGDLMAFSVVKAYFLFFIPCSLFLLLSIHVDQDDVSGKIQHMLVNLSVFQSVCIILDFFFPVVRGFFSSIVIPHPSLEYTWLRAGGLSSSAGDGLSFFQAFLGVITIGLYLEKMISRWYLVFAYFINLISLLFVGRTGFILLLLGSVLLPLLTIGWARSVKLILGGGSIAFFCLVSGLFVLPAEIREFMFDNLLPYALEIFYSIFSSGSLASESTNDILENMLVFPDDWSGWLIGHGIFQDPVIEIYNYMGTDIGYLRILFYCGLVGSLALYGGFAYIFIRFSAGRRRGALLAVLGIMFFLANLKGVVFIFGSFVALFFLLLTHSDGEWVFSQRRGG